MRAEKIFNDILGFRMLVDNYDSLLETKILKEIRVVDMSHGKASDDGYRGVYLYYQANHFYYSIEIQANTYYDRQMYKREYSDSVGRILRREYENGKILNEQGFQEVLRNVLSGGKEI